MKEESKSVEGAIIQCVNGAPNKTDKKEASRFKAFLSFFLPRLRKQEELAIAYEEATVRKAGAEGERLIQEAAKLAAERDIAKQEELRMFQENVERTFNPGDPPEVMLLKMAKLLEVNPGIAAQLERVNAVIGRLALNKNCQVTFQDLSNRDGGNGVDDKSFGR